MQTKRYKVPAVDYSKRGSKNAAESRIHWRDAESCSGSTKVVGKDNEGLILTPLSSDTDLTRIKVECDEELGAEEIVTSDSEWVYIPSLGVRQEKTDLSKALGEYYNTKVEMKRFYFDQAMREIEHKVNDVLDYVESLKTDLRFRRMNPSCFYEIKAQNEIDVFLVLDKISPSDVTIDETVYPQGCARVRFSSYPGFNQSGTSDRWRRMELYHCGEYKSGVMYISAGNVVRRFKDLVQRSFEELPRAWRESCPNCKLNSQVRRERAASQKKTISQEKTVSFKETKEAYTINLIPTIECPELWPICAKWLVSSYRQWPDQTLKETIMARGVHAVAMPTTADTEDVWRLKFLNSHQYLIKRERNQSKQKCLRIVKVLCEDQLWFSNVFLPVHLENIALLLFQRRPRERDWVDEAVPDRFLELLAMVYQCLRNRKCRDFFIPDVNLFSDMSVAVSQTLSVRVLNILTDPLKYLK